MLETTLGKTVDSQRNELIQLKAGIVEKQERIAAIQLQLQRPDIACEPIDSVNGLRNKHALLEQQLRRLEEALAFHACLVISRRREQNV